VPQPLGLARACNTHPVAAWTFQQRRRWSFRGQETWTTDADL